MAPKEYQAARALGSLGCTHVPPSSVAAFASPKPPSNSPKGPMTGKHSSDSESSEADLDRFDRSRTARACRANQRRASRERTAALARRSSCFAVPDGNEATAPHRQRHLKDRVQRRAALGASLARQPTRPTLEPEITRAELASTVEGEVPKPGSASLVCHTHAEQPFWDKRTRERRHRLGSCSRAEADKKSANAIRSLLS